jgi:undecaprenyl-diphosphatase
MLESLPEIWKAVVLGIVEGISEFLPISSTGHLIIASDLLNFAGSLGGTFEIFIQLGAVLAVLWYYRRELWRQARVAAHDRTVQSFWLNILIAFIPAALVGLLVHDWIKETLFTPGIVAAALIIGGVVVLLVERRDHSTGASSIYAVSRRQALGIGLAQTLSLIPGVSRAAASIVGGLLCGLDRPTATGFSFYLAIPTLGIATVYDLLTSLDQVTGGDALNLLVGTAVSFAVSLLVIRWLLRYISTHDFKPFGVYRIVLGVLVIAWFYLLF